MYPEDGNKPTMCGDQQGTLPPCAPLAVPYVPFQQNNPKRYSQMDALNNGTLFPGLNLPFRAKVDATALPQTAMTELQALEFVVHELILYLDTHPGDMEAFELLKQYSAMEQAARTAYVSKRGPLTHSDAAMGKTFSWPEGPWPWTFQEGGMK